MPMLRDRINTIFHLIVAVCAVCGVVLTYLNFARSADMLEIEFNGQIDGQKYVAFDRTLDLKPANRLSTPIVGPVFWRLTIRNKTDREVTIESVSARYRTKSDGFKHYDGMRVKLRENNWKADQIEVPVRLAPFDSDIFKISLYIPIYSDFLSASYCKGSRFLRKNLVDLQKCYLKNGKDMFGNKIRPIYDKNNFNRIEQVVWVETHKQPNFIFSVRTSTGAVFEAPFDFY